MHFEHPSSILTLSDIIRRPHKELSGRMRVARGIRGFPLGFLESHLHQLGEKGEGEAFID